MGWYPDPTDPDQERYWEGSRWTHNVREPVEPVPGRFNVDQADGQGVPDLGHGPAAGIDETNGLSGAQAGDKCGVHGGRLAQSRPPD